MGFTIEETLSYEPAFEREESFQLKLEMGYIPYEKLEWDENWIPEAFLPDNR